jgi:hypothetical protein
MIFQRTYVLYLIASLILLNITDYKYVHDRRLNSLKGQNDYFSGENANAGINYWNYRRRLEPENTTVLEILSIYYLMANNNSQAKETLNDALCTAPKDYKDRPKLLRSFVILSKTNTVNCQNRGYHDLFQSLFKL